MSELLIKLTLWQILSANIKRTDSYICIFKLYVFNSCIAHYLSMFTNLHAFGFINNKETFFMIHTNIFNYPYTTYTKNESNND